MAFKPDGYPSLSPYLILRDAEGAIAFMEDALGGTLVRRFDRPDGSLMHAEVRIDDSIVMVGGAGDDWPQTETHLHLYVPDPQALFDRAIAAGAQSVQEPARRDGDDLRGGVKDACGVTWWFASL